MLASQLCVFDDKTDSKPKVVKKHIVWLCCLKYLVYLWRYRFVIWSLCNLEICLMIMMHAEWMCHALTQRIRTTKTSSSTKSATVDKFITKNTTN